MATTKKTVRSRKKTVPTPALSKAYESEISYETKIIITVLLLLFVYPVGLIVMWFWMREWPLWLKVLISLPVVIFLAMLAIFVLFIGAAIHRSSMENTHYMRRNWYQQNYMQQVTPLPTLTPTGSSVTY